MSGRILRPISIAIGFLIFAGKCATPGHPVSDCLLDGLTGGVLIAAGYVDLRRRGSHGVGNVLILAGVLWFSEDLVTILTVPTRTLGPLLGEAPTPVLTWLILSFPATRLRGRLNWFLVVASAIVSWILTPLYEYAYASAGYTYLAFHWHVSASTTDFLHELQTSTEVPVALGVAVLLVVRLLRVTSARRRIVRPIYLASILATVCSGAEAFIESASSQVFVNFTIRELSNLSVMMVPTGFLISSLTLELGRARLAALLRFDSGSASMASLEDALRLSVGDDLLAVRPAVGDVPVDSVVSPGRVLVRLVDGEHEVGTLDVDGVLQEAGGILDTLEVVCLASLRRRALNDALERQFAEVVDSRARLVQAADDARRRVERDLHDGAQQTLVAASMALRQAIRRPQDRDRLLAEVDLKLRMSLQELRDLSRGVAPPLLAEQGLGPALRALRDRCPMAVGLHGLPDQRLPEEVERAAYFVVAESLTNAAKHASAARVDVTICCTNDTLLVTIDDDGVGGARLGEGGGLRGLQDRVAAARGQLAVDSPAGKGTRIAVTLPFASVLEG